MKWLKNIFTRKPKIEPAPIVGVVEIKPVDETAPDISKESKLMRLMSENRCVDISTFPAGSMCFNWLYHDTSFVDVLTIPKAKEFLFDSMDEDDIIIESIRMGYFDPLAKKIKTSDMEFDTSDPAFKALNLYVRCELIKRFDIIRLRKLKSMSAIDHLIENFPQHYDY